MSLIPLKVYNLRVDEFGVSQVIIGNKISFRCLTTISANYSLRGKSTFR